MTQTSQAKVFTYLPLNLKTLMKAVVLTEMMDFMVSPKSQLVLFF